MHGQFPETFFPGNFPSPNTTPGPPIGNFSLQIFTAKRHSVNMTVGWMLLNIIHVVTSVSCREDVVYRPIAGGQTTANDMAGFMTRYGVENTCRTLRMRAHLFYVHSLSRQWRWRNENSAPVCDLWNRDSCVQTVKDFFRTIIRRILPPDKTLPCFLLINLRVS